MVKIKFLGPIAQDDLCLDLHSLQELKAVLQEKQELKEWLDFCALSLNGEIISDKNTKLNSGDEICILPPVCGG